LHVIIPTYRSPYGGVRIAQTNGGEALASTQQEECWKLIKDSITPSISPGFIVEVAEGNLPSVMIRYEMKQQGQRTGKTE
jgi:hypothetical protein